MKAIAQKQAAADEQRRRDLEACGITNRACRDAADRKNEERLKQLEIEGNDEKTRHSKAKVDADLKCATYSVPESRPCRLERAEESRRYAENMGAIKKEEYDTWNQNFRDEVGCRGKGQGCQRDAERKAEQRSKRIEAKYAAENKRHASVNLQLDRGNCALEEMVVTAKLLSDCLPAPTPPQRQELQSGLDELKRFFVGPGQPGLPVAGMGQQADITVTTMGDLTKEYLEDLRDGIPAAIQRLQHPENVITDEVRRQVEDAARRYQEAQAAVRYLSNDDARQEMNDKLWEDAQAAVDSVRQNPARAVGAIAFQVLKDKIEGAVKGAGGFCRATPPGVQRLQARIDQGKRAVQRFPNFKPPAHTRQPGGGQPPPRKQIVPPVQQRPPQASPTQQPPAQRRQPAGGQPPPGKQVGSPVQQQSQPAARKSPAQQPPPSRRGQDGVIQLPNAKQPVPQAAQRPAQKAPAQQSPPQRRQDGVIDPQQGKTPPPKQPPSSKKEQDKTRPIAVKDQDKTKPAPAKDQDKTKQIPAKGQDKTKPIPAKDQDKTKPISQPDKDKGKDLPKNPD